MWAIAFQQTFVYLTSFQHNRLFFHSEQESVYTLLNNIQITLRTIQYVQNTLEWSFLEVCGLIQPMNVVGIYGKDHVAKLAPRKHPFRLLFPCVIVKSKDNNGYLQK